MEKKKLYVLTGFLGAGKTTFLLHLLDKLADKKIGVIQNEFGKLGIDGELINRNGIEMKEINRGSIFCSCLKLSFVQALAEMSRLDLEYVFVESSGLADPSNIEEILAAVTAIAGEAYELKGVICLIDGVNFLHQLSDVETVDRQLAHCHIAVVNKIDLIDNSQLTKVMEAVKKVNPICKIAVCKNGNLDLAFLEENLTALQWAACEDSSNTVDNKPKTISLESSALLSKEILTKFLNAVLPDCYRIKGFFRLNEGWHQIDVVEKLIDFKPCPPKEISQLVFLSKIGPNIIRTIDGAWKEIIARPMKLKN
ncbi:CobW family GTP-binding protein [Treponema pedis]|uniref:CobW family GTP-binding protein n=1 Tax=Treponema pedis TaxID=409322 RepID=UPI00041CB386|nr:GTP-binding protein [Treponema pedis]